MRKYGLLAMFFLLSCHYNNPFLQGTYSLPTGPLPVAKITGVPEGITNVINYSLVVTGSNITQYKYSIDNSAADTTNDIDNPLTLNLTDGDHKLLVWGCTRDGIWQDETSPTKAEWKIDTGYPRLSISGTPSNPTGDTSINITVTSTEGAAYYKYSLNNGILQIVQDIAIGEPISVKNLANGEATLIVYGGDRDKNYQKKDFCSYTWNINTNYDHFIVNNNGVFYFNIPNPTITGTAAAGVKLIVTYEDNTTSEVITALDGTWSVSLPYTTEGIHKVNIKSLSSLGIYSPTELVSVTIDTTPPIVTINATAPTAVTSPELSGTINDPSADLTITVNSIDYTITNFDSGKWTLLAGTISPPLTNNTYTVTAKAKDPATNIGQAATSLTIDTTLPTPILTGLPEKQTKSQEINITVTNDNISTYSYTIQRTTNPIETIDSVADTPLSSPLITKTGLIEGSYKITVTGKNTLDVRSATTYEWSVDLTPPTPVIATSITDNLTNQTTASFTISGDDVEKYRYSIDSETIGTDEAVVSTPIQLSDISEGTHKLRVIGCDAAGNWGTTPVEYDWYIDMTPPVITLTETNGDTDLYLKITDSFVEPGFLYSDDHSAESDIIWTLPDYADIKNIAGKQNKLTYTAIDKAGNKKTAVRNVSFWKMTIDNTKEFTDKSKLSTSSESSFKVYFDYDDTFLYFGVDGMSMTGDNNIVCIAINTAETENEGTNQTQEAGWFEGSLVNLPFKAKYLYMMKSYTPTPENILTPYNKFIETTQQWQYNDSISKRPNAGKTEVFYSPIKGTSYNEYAINRKNIGSPASKIKVSLYFKYHPSGETNKYGELKAFAPIGASTTGTGKKTISKYFEFDLSNPAISPNNPANIKP